MQQAAGAIKTAILICSNPLFRHMMTLTSEYQQHFYISTRL
jgi:hypothetical protein